MTPGARRWGGAGGLRRGNSALAIVGRAGDRIGEHRIGCRQALKDERRVGAGAIGVPTLGDRVERATDLVGSSARSKPQHCIEVIWLLFR